jgi:FixJ family two-component response regulator
MAVNPSVSEKPLVCVVDDDSLIRDSTLRLIRSFGFRGKAFPSADEFRKSNEREETACVILDIRMPGMSGIELQRLLTFRHHEIPVIFITACEDEGVRTQAIREGATAFLIKPVSEECLLNAIQAALTRKQGETKTQIV